MQKDLCRNCKHYLFGLKCEAFPGPDGIPGEILVGDNDHDKPFKGDNGIRFEEGSNAEALTRWNKQFEANAEAVTRRLEGGEKLITTEQAIVILKEVTLDMPPSIKTKEALAYRRQLKKEIKAMPKGAIVEIPGDIEGPETE